jgi:hypothetical protein
MDLSAFHAPRGSRRELILLGFDSEGKQNLAANAREWYFTTEMQKHGGKPLKHRRTEETKSRELTASGYLPIASC